MPPAGAHCVMHERIFINCVLYKCFYILLHMHGACYQHIHHDEMVLCLAVLSQKHSVVIQLGVMKHRYSILTSLLLQKLGAKSSFPFVC